MISKLQLEMETRFNQLHRELTRLDTVTAPMTTATTGDVEMVGAQGTPAIYLF